MQSFPDHAQLANLALIEELYQRYLENPENVDPSWRHFFEGIDVGSYLYKRGAEPAADQSAVRIFDLIQSYRRYGHLLAHFNPLDPNEQKVPELDLERLGFFESELQILFPTLGFCGKPKAPLQEILDALKSIYASRIGFEYMDLGNPDLEKWMQERLEPELLMQPSIEDKHLLLEYLYKSEVLETFLHTRYVGQTRFSLEGAETMIPIIAEIIDLGGDLGVSEVLIGMAHRGRLNVLVNILNKPKTLVFEEFEDDTTLSFSGNDDVKYHMGFSGELTSRSGKKILVSVAANPSHLESVDPVVLGEVHALQILKKDKERRKIAPLLIHGDSSVAGQGVIYESLQFMNLKNYTTGGTIHLVVNNQIGYTTLPEEGRSTRYCTDIAKAFSCPVFHVNAEDPESCLFAAKLATEIRQKFQCDVFIDLVCYRKYGHNEGDEPSFTQPVQYRMIRSKKTIREIYSEQLLSEGRLEQKMAEALQTEYQDSLKKALEEAKGKTSSAKITPPPEARLLEPFDSAIPQETVKMVIQKFCQVPDGFHHHPKLDKWLQDRLAMRAIDWATGECLAFGSLLLQGVAVRLAGQDSRRGTFSQRHLVWADAENGSLYFPLSHLKEGQARFDAINSPLTEYAGMAFEYGYSLVAPQTLVLWEAQYGDFNNGAQIVIDQYIASAEQKWNTPSSLVLLLPHAYEGAGPEHSSARLERFLQLASSDNMQIVNASTPSQYFHVLRRQGLRKIKKPLILFTPKGLLRAPACTSTPEEFSHGHFEEILDDPKPPSLCKRLLLCSGKIYYDLQAQREKKKIETTALVRIEQYYPLHLEKLKKILAKYTGFTECFWVQEEPENMGAWSFLRPYLQALLPKSVSFHYAGRPANASPSTGSHKKHKVEQQALLDQVL